MFLLNYFTDGCPQLSYFNDTKGLADAVTGITNDPYAGRAAEAIASGMAFGDEFVRPGLFKITCVTDAQAAEAVIENWARPGS